MIRMEETKVLEWGGVEQPFLEKPQLHYRSFGPEESTGVVPLQRKDAVEYELCGFLKLQELYVAAAEAGDGIRIAQCASWPPWALSKRPLAFLASFMAVEIGLLNVSEVATADNSVRRAAVDPDRIDGLYGV
eukprot:CAMPEP_0114490690 /NCGR_PEP_ID=MMETSP0109-20121206/2583_1 /TAXON_ID=29199 /ORGANISM="Chlorarachnion reptans, Strain CCCM449" /LENGTH=131 /DNA_ID=CAMNT_0001667337 /DNA_START=319 /DNA_END=716 /DNA_ORIENTATION=+